MKKKILSKNIYCFINARITIFKIHVLWCAIIMDFSSHIWDFYKYRTTLNWSTEASFKYFYARPKYVIRDIVIYCCLNLQTRSCIQQAQKQPFLNFEFCKICAFLCLLCAQYYVRQYIYMSCKTYFGLVKKYLKPFVVEYLKV